MSNAWSDVTPLPDDLLAAKSLVYDPCGFTCSQPIAEPEGGAYAAHTFTLNGLTTRFRTGKTTPTKVGQFVTVWTRSLAGPIRPFDTTDAIDLVVVSTRSSEHFGHFVFTMDTLSRHGITSVNGTAGKRAFRVYPPWVDAPNRQATAAQSWQLDHFLYLPTNAPIDIARARSLYGHATV
ncbi:MepB family protein [Nocardia sp. NBC_01503]|uniref:MepB family protein n=1 Tax=Nocardia sp. NBC_01503 TaxID=2975997 RepID=UPI002E7BDF12|nr:MepB family protein [Nocardia sp. NBC_01503]WTL31267.1 MepB family protein [Nocardia sp. NBC_01503]